ncbi:MAG: ABC transporter permease [Gemmatimonadota bacterium]|jgi:ABC-type multidrug transport system permease subunit
MGERNSLHQLALWRFREFVREPEALFWVFAFPVLLALALGIAFRNRGLPVSRVVVAAETPGADSLAAELSADPRIEASVLDSVTAATRLRTGRIALLVRGGDPAVLEYDSTRSESDVAQLLVRDALQRIAGRRDVATISARRITEPGARYIDFLIPGLLGLNIMGTGMWGVGFGIVRSRQHKLLKRFLASPMRKRDFMLGNIMARLVFLLLEVPVVVLFGRLAFGVPVRGSWFTLAVLAVAGAMTFAGVGLLVASRARTVEGVSGLMNLVMVPMWIFSGVFFAWSNFPDSFEPFIRALPLTALNDAIRAVMLEGTPLLGTLHWVGIMAAWGLGSFLLALRLFRWE